MQLIKNKTIVLLINHYMTRAEGSEETDQRTLNFLLDKTKKIVHIAHPFPNSPFRETVLEIFENGVLIKEEKISGFKGPEILQYLFHFLLNWYLFIKTGPFYDLSIALENLSFMSIYPLRILSIVKRVVYYSVDYSPKRFQNTLLNNFYHGLDKFACTHSDLNWIMVKEQIGQRKKRDQGIKHSPFALAPIGYKRSLIKIKSSGEADPYHLIFAGALLENSGPQLGISALPLLLRKFPKIHYTIIGRGVFESTLKGMVKKLNLGKKVKFLGYIPKFSDLTDALSSAGIALAPFVPNPDSLSYYSDPSKIKLYLVSGLPVITTNVTTIAPLIKKSKAGEVIKYSGESLCQAVESMIKSKKIYDAYKKAAVVLSEKYDIDNILKKAFYKIP